MRYIPMNSAWSVTAKKSKGRFNLAGSPLEAMTCSPLANR